MTSNKTYFILINSGMAYDSEYEIRGEKKIAHHLGAVISRHHTIQAALRARDKVTARALNPIKTDILRLHFWPHSDDFIAEAYGGPYGFRYNPCSCLISQ
jgi:hypothetical protein